MQCKGFTRVLVSQRLPRPPSRGTLAGSSNDSKRNKGSGSLAGYRGWVPHGILWQGSPMTTDGPKSTNIYSHQRRGIFQILPKSTKLYSHQRRVMFQILLKSTKLLQSPTSRYLPNPTKIYSRQCRVISLGPSDRSESKFYRQKK